MNEYSYKPKRKNKSDIVLSVALYLSAAVLYGFSVGIDGIKYVSVMQMSALVFIVAAFYITLRYQFTYFIYSIKPETSSTDDEAACYNFMIHKIQGKKSVLAVKLKSTDLLRICKCTSKEKLPSELSSYQNPSRYFYLQTLHPAEYYTAVFKPENDGFIFISFEPDSVLKGMLESSITTNAE